MKIFPTSGEIKSAKKHPGGWIYRIAKEYENAEIVPPEAVIGAWKVNRSGKITGEFHINPNHTPTK